MNTEEKARKYDEALERARKQRGYYQKELDKTDKNSQLAGLLRAGISAVEMIFPELIESEDERIRKWILEKMQGYAASGIPCSDEIKMADKAIDYLEKQKEQKPVPIKPDDMHMLERIMELVEFCNDKEMIWNWLCEKVKEQKPVRTAKEAWKEMRLEVYAQASGNRHEPNYSDDSTKMFSLCDIDEIFEKIGNSTVRSQPAEWIEEDIKKIRSEEYTKGFNDAAFGGKLKEWSEEDDKMCNNILNVLTPHLVYDGTYTGTSLGKKYKYGDEIRWLKALSLSFKKRNEDITKLCSNEWSEEDKKQIAQIERICKNAGCSKMLQEKIHNWFDSLCFKMVKWDTDMMSIRNSIRNVLYKEKKCPNAWFTYLEHCGPQTKYAYWKPSEEQLEALDKAIPVCMGVAGRDEVAPLESLYEHLKKL